MRSLWKGAVSFGLVHIPIKLFAATEDKDIRFRLLHKECNRPIQYQKRCSHCDREVESEEIVKGFEYTKGRFVIVTEEDLSALEPEGSRSIDIQSFVHLAEIDPIYFVKTYYLAPDQQGEKAYALLHRALQETNRLALAKVILRSKETIAALRIYGDALAMHIMLFPEEIRSIEGLGLLGQGLEISDKEQKMAVQLIESLTEPFDPQQWQNEYNEKLQQWLQEKVQGEAVAEIPTTTAAPKGKVVDLMEALKVSLNQAKEEQKKTAKKEKAGKSTVSRKKTS
ncbi:Ku protein [Heliorestis acidaminivorans]|uniref:Non-homologous end joining protein Ku n=1 Tax=Heliorestis acidaminivorans TaxID=553427 RepID=A0A6I0ETC2_9FIRM|nr:Ku protein [Heliorestis acidaminivorans]KAB2952308.1 Ku protein [Heliorestis acidaminivorans]